MQWAVRKKLQKKIRKEKAEYILSVKENHTNLYDEIRSSFSMLKSESFEPPIEADHGRIETRKYSFINNLRYISRIEEWKDIQSIIKIESERIIKKTG